MKTLLLPSFLSLIFFAATCSAADTPVQLAKLEPASTGMQTITAAHWNTLNPKNLKLKSAAVLVLDQYGKEVYSKHVGEPRPIASITKLMTAMVVLDSDLDLQEKIAITKDDRDLIQLTGSRLKYGAALTRKQMLQLALMSSENRAANALARTWPQGKAAFVAAMNKKARTLGMHASHFNDPAGLDPGNVASAHDTALMVRAAMSYPLIRNATTTRSARVRPYKDRGELRFNNTNRLLKNKTWDIQLSKTGYLNESGRCLVMQAEIDDQPLTIVLLNSYGKLTPFGDSNRIRKWIESGD
ncbi:MAG: serine hydrolase [Gammaproteobacteria bacterium]|nr:serine hydrolase [Gammaproteobacteria bacterium]MDH3888275.1 serine hydrolase [Gammaproteobacteria bacterium]MDH3986489.1 serine hydrolase [Gammaproteobacteria bacterium]